MKLILASGSPRRAQVLRDAAIVFEPRPAGVDETRRPGEPAETFVRRLAESKARAAARGLEGAALVVGADTEVVLDADVLGKPAGADEARRMLTRLSGRTHLVLTGIAVLRLPDGELRVEHESTQVTFAEISAAEIERYVASGEPFDKAGGYGIQSRGGRFITRVEGCYFNIVGLPLGRLYRMLREMGWQPDQPPAGP